MEKYNGDDRIHVFMDTAYLSMKGYAGNVLSLAEDFVPCIEVLSIVTAIKLQISSMIRYRKT